MTSTPQRALPRVRLDLPARLTWKDPSGALRFAAVVARDVSPAGAFVEMTGGANIPLYRLVHLQFDRDGRHASTLPAFLRKGRLLSAIWRVGPCRRSTGTPEGYALRFLVDPHENSCDNASDVRMPVAS